ncbi:MAG: type III pantothenate kinase [Cyclobacteriaceae bacterium]
MGHKANYVIDIGNTRIKSGWVTGDVVEEVKFWKHEQSLEALIPHNSKTIICSVGQTVDKLKNISSESLTIFNRDTPINLKLNYDTPETLGLDRIAAAVGAHSLSPRNTCLVIDLGTCITYDIVTSDAVFHGGIIAPGFIMRLKSMHQQTANLPDLSEKWEMINDSLLGKSTAECMVSGALNGMVEEMKGIIQRFKAEYPDLSIIVTGGDAEVFVSKINDHIFVRPNLVMVGLNQILIYNEDM